MAHNTAGPYTAEIPQISAPAVEATSAAENAAVTPGPDREQAAREPEQFTQAQLVPKNPAVALIVSFFLPGVGSMISGQPAVGAAILVAYILGWILTLVIVGFLILLAAWVFGLVHAYQSAQRWNREHGFVS
jgi:TM2 domain-containing membrane protein YozV